MKQHLMKLILGLCPETEHRKSCLMMALQSARYQTGRDIKTGKVAGVSEMLLNVNMHDEVLENGMEEAEMFTGLTLYLILLEQMGILFGKTDKGNGIKRILNTVGNKISSGLNKEQIDAICDLRNTLAHNFGLATEYYYNKKEKIPHRKFTLLFNDDAPAVCLPKQEWDGQFSNKHGDTATEISLPALCDLVEEVFCEIRVLCEGGELKLNLEESEAETRFTIRI